ncbi:hypothetical protein CesoFtcFv8_008874 [Champsocephalus esox]|uniref:Uncharacterized protein n=1 Tax=Champsocephalus esox TaxID=159716 RepID=A0AAN8C9F1_9TELE|nr:hypothetical protein CesoFtcFv8_008874 [Champsocephalus esox]
MAKRKRRIRDGERKKTGRADKGDTRTDRRMGRMKERVEMRDRQRERGDTEKSRGRASGGAYYAAVTPPPVRQRMEEAEYPLFL